MKKLLALTLSLALLAGCSGGFTAGGENYLDEKIKCKKLADERFAELQKEHEGWLDTSRSNYVPSLDTCLISYSYLQEENNEVNNYRVIEDLLTQKQIATRFMPHQPKDAAAATRALRERDDFDQKLKLYFGEDAK